MSMGWSLSAQHAGAEVGTGCKQWSLTYIPNDGIIRTHVKGLTINSRDDFDRDSIAMLKPTDIALDISGDDFGNAKVSFGRVFAVSVSFRDVLMFRRLQHSARRELVSLASSRNQQLLEASAGLNGTIEACRRFDPTTLR